MRLNQAIPRKYFRRRTASTEEFFDRMNASNMTWDNNARNEPKRRLRVDGLWYIGKIEVMDGVQDLPKFSSVKNHQVDHIVIKFNAHERIRCTLNQVYCMRLGNR